MRRNVLTKTVWTLSLISLFTDMASEMLYPIMPLYLKSIGFSVVLIGILEGLAEAVAGLSKSYFGKLSDSSGRRAPFVQWGYALSALSKPLMAVLAQPVWVFMVRTLDRLGKGLRTGARDAILSEEATPATKGKVFGFHRSMDTLGAVLGPLLALLYLQWYPEDYRTLFILALGPGILAIACSLLLKDKKKKTAPARRPVPFFAFAGYWKTSSATYKRLAGGLLLFTLFNSSDVFLLLQAKRTGIGDAEVIGLYIFYNLIFALAAFPLGILADRLGLKQVLLTGLFVFAIVYAGMAFAGPQLPVLYALFFLYGIYAAATEGISKAWISNICEPSDIATAIGTFSGLQSICTLLASTLAGLIWYYAGAAATFLTSSIITLLCIGWLSYTPYRKAA